MTSAEFIEREFENADGKEKYHSSIYKDGKGYIYSYGTHYPLLFTVNGTRFRNTSGYSNTTAKHISWCSWFGAIDVELDFDTRRIIASWATDGEKLDAITKCLNKKRLGILAEMESKKRKDTQVYQWLERDLEDVSISLQQVTGERVYA